MDEGGGIAVAITGVTDAEIFDAVTLTAVVTGGVSSSRVWTQTAGPTATTIGSTTGVTYTFEVPGVRVDTPYVLSFRVTAQPGDVQANYDVTVTPATWLVLSGGEWQPTAIYIITA
jgi:hypothetical protein